MRKLSRIMIKSWQNLRFIAPLFFANQRFADVHQYQTHDSQIHWINTADNAKHIRPAMTKKMRFKQGYIDVVRPDSATFQCIIREQYQYGYEWAWQCLTSG